MKRTLTMERTLTLALISLCVTLCLGSVPACDTELNEDEKFSTKSIFKPTIRSSPSARHCQLMCTQDPECSVFSFHTPSSPSKKYSCQMWKNSEPFNFQREKMTGVTSGFNLKDCPQHEKPCMDEVYNEVVFTNKPYSTLQTINHKECREKCRQDQSCHFYTYYKSSSQCELKFTMPMPTPNISPYTKDVFSGFSNNLDMDFGSGEVCRPEFHVDVQLDDGEYDLKYRTLSPEHCQALCNIHPQCHVFMFIRSDEWKENCLVKSSENSKTISIKKPGVTSGRAQKGCKVDFRWKDVVHEGIFYMTFLSWISQPDLKSCQESCNKIPNCLAYLYVSKDYFEEVYRMNCFFAQAVTFPTPDVVVESDAVSGFGMKCSVWKCE